jgi:hypothetical protein
MLAVLPRRALFQFELPIHHRARVTPIDGDLSKWPAKYMLPPLVELEEAQPFADVYAAWNDEHFFIAFDVPERRGPLHCDPAHWWKQDGVRICIDTRDARDVKRATRFCHLFYVLPTGGGPQRNRPIAGLHRMSRAKEPSPTVDVSQLRVGVRNSRRGYSLEVAIPAACLAGWSPADHPRIGLFYKIRDTRLGDQHLSVDDELGWNVDPSTWATGVLVR